MTRTRWAMVLALLLMMAASLLAVDAGDARQKEKSHKVGQVTLTACKDRPQLWCGSLPVPLDHDDPKAGKLQIGFAWRPAERNAKGTLVAQEGGPGYPSIESYGLWRGMFGPLLKDYNLLMVDTRGTGRSHVVDCKPLQEFDYAQSNKEFFAAVADCGKQLDHTFRRGNGDFVHASDLFGTADAADDLAAVIRELKVGPVNLYGDSYGTFFAQTFAARHPDLLRALVLDGTWPLVNADPWYPETLETLRFAFDAVCARSAPCNEAAPGSATDRLAELADALRENPISGDVPRSGQKPQHVTVRATDLAALAWSAGAGPGIYRDLDAAGRAALDGDPLPLLRLASRNSLNGTISDGWPVETYSTGLAVALPCIDYPQLYEMAAAPDARAQQFAAEMASLPAGFFSPFANEDWLNNPIQDYNQCVPWPALEHERELAPEGFPLVPPSLPVLVLAGDLDSVTALGGAETAVAQLGPSARLVVFPNSTHVVAQGDIVGCGSAIVREFLRDPRRLDELDTSCVSLFPEIRARGAFPLELADQALPEPQAGNEASLEEQRLAALAVNTAGDALTYPAKKGRKLAGLRGGTIASNEAKKGPRVLTLTNVRYAGDVAVSGTVTIPKNPAAPVVAKLKATADDGTVVSLTASWRSLEPGAQATVEGLAGATPLRVTMPAP